MKTMSAWMTVAMMSVLVSGSAFADDADKNDKSEKSDRTDKSDKSDKANDAVSCDEGAFAEKMESGKPVGDASAIAAARRATYFVTCKNTGEATQVTLVWKLDGKEVQRQALDVGHSSHWKTWGTRPLGSAKLVEVEVLEAGGGSLKTDKLELP